MTDRIIHPDPEVQRAQCDIIQEAPEGRRGFLAFAYRTRNVLVHYYGSRLAEPTREDFDSWLKLLSEADRRYAVRQGFEVMRWEAGLRRIAAELNDVGLDAYMQESVSSEDYAEWRKYGGGGVERMDIPDC